MATEILKSFGTLQSELEQARSNLKGVDENIKRLIGRDPSEILPRPGTKRPPQIEDNRSRRAGGGVLPTKRVYNHENDEPQNKRRTGSVFKRLSERQTAYEEEIEQKPLKQMISKVIVTPKEIPSRLEALAAQNNDEKSKARNRRMFGALLGTLQKFQQEETKLKPKEEKRAQLEKKIEEHEIREKAEIKKERRELFFNRKKKQAEIKMIELKMLRMKEYSIWEERQKPRMNFIQTKAKPHIHYLPRKLNEKSKADLEECRNEIEKLIDTKRQEVFDDLQHIEDNMKKNFDRKPKQDKNEDDKELDEEMKADNDSGDDAAIGVDDNNMEADFISKDTFPNNTCLENREQNEERSNSDDVKVEKMDDDIGDDMSVKISQKETSEEASTNKVTEGEVVE